MREPRSTRQSKCPFTFLLKKSRIEFDARHDETADAGTSQATLPPLPAISAHLIVRKQEAGWPEDSRRKRRIVGDRQPFQVKGKSSWV